jgi:hypothetical protein
VRELLRSAPSAAKWRDATCYQAVLTLKLTWRGTCQGAHHVQLDAMIAVTIVALCSPSHHSTFIPPLLLCRHHIFSVCFFNTRLMPLHLAPYSVDASTTMRL